MFILGKAGALGLGALGPPLAGAAGLAPRGGGRGGPLGLPDGGAGGPPTVGPPTTDTEGTSFLLSPSFTSATRFVNAEPKRYIIIDEL